MKIMTKILENKLIFVETKVKEKQDMLETVLALDNYKKACDCGRGAIFFAVAGEKIGKIKLTNHYSRCVLIFGLPYESKLDRHLKAQIANSKLTTDAYLQYNALKTVTQCLNNCMDSVDDYCLMILADSRFAYPENINNLP